MGLKVHRSGSQVRARRDRLTSLRERIQKQINDADCLLAAIDEYCRENPDDCACVASDPNWREQIVRQHEELAAMLMAIREKIVQGSNGKGD